ncbi:MAG TPA: nuclear transport factor 2 family protein [Amycolatopsis sp.]|uniref:nuclear transport factor 2 family protein n=1 Tax=Amycolatopsis sp. TaxID=37632 RepID=UPI002B462082|nr:nuclear transport factor 2 family protein [Amycolatopsis sp.]HKS48225.1 nuclear transport factor 2 family protein [Amycolatopsis sp.]
MAPREVFEHQGISEGRYELGALYAEDTVVEHPQRPPAGSRIVGRRAAAERFATAGRIEPRARDVVIHETTDREVIVAEFTCDGKPCAPLPAPTSSVPEGGMNQGSPWVMRISHSVGQPAASVRTSAKASRGARHSR